MGRRKRNSSVLAEANARLNGLKGIDPTLDFGNGLTVGALEQAIDSLQAKLGRYNQKLSEVDEELFGVEAEEDKLNDLNSRVLAGIAARFGRNSVQYEKVGGVRSDDRKRAAGKKGTDSSSQK
jgi:hypothetical protein